MNQTGEWRDNDPDKETAEKWNKDPKNWIWGLFYYNKDDKRIFVSKKTEWMGTTLNFANKNWIIYMVLFISFFSFVLFIILRNK